jgi:hypothetical protein
MLPGAPAPRRVTGMQPATAGQFSPSDTDPQERVAELAQRASIDDRWAERDQRVLREQRERDERARRRRYPKFERDERRHADAAADRCPTCGRGGAS